MKRISSQSGAIGVNLETLEPRRLLSGTVEVVEMLESDLPSIEMPPLIEEQSPKYEPVTDEEMIARGYEKGIVGRNEVWVPRGKAIFRIELDLPMLMRESADGHQYGDMTRPWEGSEAATQEIIARIEALAPGVTVTGGELYGATGEFFVELGDMTLEAFANATADLGGVTTHVTTLRVTVMPSYAWGQSFLNFSTPTPVEQPPADQPQDSTPSPFANVWNDTSGNSRVDLDDDADDAILLLTNPAGELLG